ncbi:hypothetical protein P3T24_000583 [Paraburkholderia sp. GAS33]|jgi:hypothetical protein
MNGAERLVRSIVASGANVWSNCGCYLILPL